MQGEDQGRLTSTALALDWPTAEFNRWMFASASSQDHATQITQEGEHSGGFYRASGQALRSGTDSELRKNRGAYEDTFSTTVNVWKDDLGRYITGLGNYWFVKRGKGIQFILDQTEEGDEVELDSGTFTENIAIDKFLNIYGQGIGFTTIGAKDIGTPVIDITYGGEDTLSVSGLTVAGATKSDGIRFLGSGNTGNVYLSDIKSTGNGNGIDVVATGSGNSVSDVTLQGLEIAGNNYAISINAKNGGTISDLNFNGPIISNPTGSGVSINNNYGTIRILTSIGANDLRCGPGRHLDL